MGQSFQTPSPPILKYWPRAISMKNIGIPARMSVTQYGMRKAPETDGKTGQLDRVYNIRQR